MNMIKTMEINIEQVDSFLAKYGYFNKCLNGCSDCCHDYFYASVPEFFLTLHGLTTKPFNLDYFYKRALSTRSYFMHYLPLEIERLSYKAPSLLAYKVNDFRTGQYINYPDLPPCMFLVNGRCSIYDYRPNTCRKYGTTVTCEYLDNEDFEDDDFTQVHLQPLYDNTALLDQSIETTPLPLWFFYSEYLKPELRSFVFKQLEHYQINNIEKAA